MSAPDTVFPGGKRYRSLGPFLRDRFGGPVRKTAVDTGHRCGNQPGCLFCTNPSAPDTPLPGTSVQLAAGIERLSQRHPHDRYLAYFRNYSTHHGSTEWLLTQLAEAAAHPAVAGLVIVLRPDELSPGLADGLSRLAATTPLWVELGLQSCDEAVLREMRRGHTLADFRQATTLLRSRRIETVAHLVFGWPGERPSAPVEAAVFLNRNGIAGVKLHHLQILHGTVLGTRYQANRFACLSVGAYLGMVAVFLAHLAAETVIHRLFSRAPAGTVIAPRWAPSQQALLSMLDARLEELGIRQGSSAEATDGY